MNPNQVGQILVGHTAHVELTKATHASKFAIVALAMNPSNASGVIGTHGTTRIKNIISVFSSYQHDFIQEKYLGSSVTVTKVVSLAGLTGSTGISLISRLLTLGLPKVSGSDPVSSRA